MGVLHTFPATKAHSLATALLARHSAQEIADAVEVLIDVLDALGGDPDLEDNDPAGQRDEDGVNTLTNDMSFLCDTGPGCPISDPGGCEHDGCEEEQGIAARYGIDQTTGPVHNSLQIGA